MNKLNTYEDITINKTGKFAAMEKPNDTILIQNFRTFNTQETFILSSNKFVFANCPHAVSA